MKLLSHWASITVGRAAAFGLHSKPFCNRNIKICRQRVCPVLERPIPQGWLERYSVNAGFAKCVGRKAQIHEIAGKFSHIPASQSKIVDEF